MPDFDAEGFEADQVYGDWVEKVVIEGKEYKFNVEDDMRLFRIMFNINSHLKNQNKAFVYYDTQDDNKCFILIDRRFLSDYVEKGFVEI